VSLDEELIIPGQDIQSLKSGFHFKNRCQAINNYTGCIILITSSTLGLSESQKLQTGCQIGSQSL